MRFEHKHVHKSSFAVMEMTHNSNIPDIVRESSHVQEKARKAKWVIGEGGNIWKLTLYHNESQANLSLRQSTFEP